MENDNTPQHENAIEKGKRQIERSAAYPAILIEEAEPFVEQILKNFPGNQSITREDISAVLPDIANIHRHIAAAVHYGLLDRDKDLYKVTQLFKDLCNPISQEEKKKFLLQIFGQPKLYQDVIAKHDGHVVPTELKTHLVRFHRIIDKVAADVADDFIKNAKYVGAINENRILIYKAALASLDFSASDVVQPLVIPEIVTPLSPSPVLIGQAQEPPKPQLLLNEINGEERDKIKLTANRIAYLVYPRNLNKKDIEILKKQIELLELTIE